MPLSALAARRLEAQRAGAATSAIDDETGNQSLDEPKPSQTIDGKSIVAPSKPVNSSHENRKRKRKQPETTIEPVQAGKASKTHEPSERRTNGSRAAIPASEAPKTTPAAHEALENTTTAIVSASISSRESDLSSAEVENEAYASDEEWEDSGPMTNRTSVEEVSDAQLSTVSMTSISSAVWAGRKAITAKLAPGQSVVAVGKFDLIVLEGSVVVLGAIIHKGSQSHRVHALSTHSLPRIQALQHPKESRPTFAGVALVECRDGLENMFHLDSTFARLDAGGETSFQVLSKTSEDLLRRPLQVFEEDGSWNILAQNLMANYEISMPRIAVCGVKGSGKSSFARFLSNTMLSRRDVGGVIFLDIDPGQPEYTVPGHLSLSLVRKFNLGPAYTHPTSFENNLLVKTHCFGFITPRDDPHHYLACIEDLFATYQRDHAVHPLIINSSGWIFGKGIEVLNEVFKTCQVTHVVNMSMERSSELSNQLGLLSAQRGSSLHTLSSNTSIIAQRSGGELRRMQSMSFFHLRPSESAVPTWDSTPLEESIQQSWNYFGQDQIIDGVMFLHDSISYTLAERTAVGSIFSVTAVYGNEEIEEAFESFRKMDDRADIQETSSWRDARAMASRLDNIDINSDPRFVPGYVIHQTQSRLAYINFRDGACQPLAPSSSTTLGQVWVKEIDVDSQSLLTVSPVSTKALNRHKKNGAKIILTRGRGYSADWAVLESYHARHSRNQDEQVNISTHRVHQSETSAEEGFDQLEWIKKTARVQLIDRRDQIAKKRRRTWRLRRNLETSVAHTKN